MTGNPDPQKYEPTKTDYNRVEGYAFQLCISSIIFISIEDFQDYPCKYSVILYNLLPSVAQ